MCARFDLNETRCKPGAIVVARGEQGIESHIWAGFARQETLAWWKRKGAEVVDIYADRFAERARGTGKLEWDDVPAGLVIRGIVDHQTGEPLIKLVTRPSTPEEHARFDHPRMPILEPPLFERLPAPAAPLSSMQPELFLNG